MTDNSGKSTAVLGMYELCPKRVRVKKMFDMWKSVLVPWDEYEQYPKKSRMWKWRKKRMKKKNEGNTNE